ncbi:putative 2OG-Fe(II) oxygenase [Porticoccaceae bacterium]|nr:putative 2OG-Fe(II) oxygenase [Porticoccaceae bacterium]MDC0494652.1 putative 2OG-Fe(II) oxygenase [bacterium]MDA8681200.1 putative 2OG-Fe(II) oxygenase [Porticoccaceae bacterium]MDB2343335.1 putative 2OG-Fe(II) oxygenase [Porticoccaceae bacterium]MDB2486838.1 putative 2OG-Fe(II) oxygenase [Porticoccaceae bacterium]
MSALQDGFSRALQSFQSGQYSDAAAQIDDLLLTAAKNPDVLHLAALNAKAQFKYTEAEAYFRASLNIAQNQPIVLSNLANLLRSMGDFSHADENYRAALKLMPTLRDAWLNRGLLAKQLLDWQQARRCLLEAVGLKPDPSISVVLFEIYLITGDLDELTAQSLLFQKTYPQYGDGYIYQSRALSRQGNDLEALEVLQNALNKVTNRAQLEYELGLFHVERADTTVAETHFITALDIVPEFIDAHRALNDLYFQSSNQNFLKSYSTALQQVPNSELLFHNLAASQSNSGDIDKGIETLKQGLKRVGKTAFLQHGLGALLVRQNRLEEAIPLFDQALTLNMTNLRFLLDRVNLAIKMADYKVCQRWLDHALLLDPFNQETWAYQGLVWRIMKDDRYDWLYNYDSFLKVYTLPTPDGYDNSPQFLTQLNDYLSTLHVATNQPLDQSVVDGTQTMGVLLDDPHPLVQDFKGALVECTDNYLAGLSYQREHPFLSRLSDDYAFSGSWSVRLKDSGHHSNHVHPFGWLSCCSYVSVNDLSEKRDGWIKFGETSLGLGSIETVDRAIQPEDGKCVFFPSYFWHGTYPLTSKHFRTTIPCDIAPAAVLAS